MSTDSRLMVMRAFELAWATLPRAPRDDLAHPFGFGQHNPHQWRLSRDVWEQLAEETEYPFIDPAPETLFLGETIRVDDALPPDSMLLEPVP